MIITIDTAQELTAQDRAVLHSLIGEPASDSVHFNGESATFTEPTLEPEKPKRTRRATKPEPVEATETASEPEPENTEDLTALLDQAIAQGTALLKAGKQQVVRDALAKAGAERVSHLSGKTQILAFLAALGE